MQVLRVVSLLIFVASSILASSSHASCRLGLVHCFDVSDLCFKSVDSILQSLIKALIHLLEGLHEELGDLDGDEGGTARRPHRLLELEEDRVADDLGVVFLKHLLFLDLDEVVEQVLHVVRQICAEVFD